MRIEELTLDEWDESLPPSGVGPFHAAEPLRVIEDHSSASLRLFGGFRGEEAVALLPAFIRREPFVTGAFSPPPGFGVPRLGPVLMPTSPKRRKQERLNRRFVDAVLDEIDVERSLLVLRFSCEPAYADPRPFRWAGFDVDHRFSYRVPLASRTTEDVLQSFSKSLRREIRDARDLDVSVSVRDRKGARKVYEATSERYAEQDVGFPVSWEFTRDVIDAMDDRARVYVAETPEGEFLSGITALYSDDACYFWTGGTRATYENVSVNSLLHWRVIEDAMTDPPGDGVARYDMYSGENERVSKYKSKFGGDLVPYYVVSADNRATAVARRLYERFRY